MTTKKEQAPDVETISVVESVDDIMDVNDVEYATIKGFKEGQWLRIGSLAAGDMVRFSEENEKVDAKKVSTLRLICKSLVGPEPENKRYAAAEKNIEVFKLKSHKNIERIAKEILKLNGIVLKDDLKKEEEAKNASGGAQPGGSPTVLH